MLKLDSTADVIHKALVLRDVELRVVLPLVRIADLDGEVRELLNSLLLRLVRHPLKLRDAILEGRLEVANHRLHTLLSLLGEVLLDIDLTERLTERAIEQIDCTTPAWVHLLDTRECLGVEVKVGLYKVVREVASIAIDGLC